MSKRKPKRPGRRARREDATAEFKDSRRDKKRRAYVVAEAVEFVRDHLGKPDMPFAEAEETMRLNPRLQQEFIDAAEREEQEANSPDGRES